MKSENPLSPNVRTIICGVDFHPIYIQTGRYVRRSREAKPRDPERTRERLLKAGFQEVYRSGFQSASIDTILAAANVTKGALYHHFESKEVLGHAIIDEVVQTFCRNRWLLPLQQSVDTDPIDALIDIVQSMPARPRDLKGGCPLANLAQEMSQLDEQFRKRLETIFRAWQQAIAMALRRGQSQGRSAATWLQTRPRAF